MNLFHIFGEKKKKKKDLGGITILQKIIKGKQFKNPVKSFQKVDYWGGEVFIKLFFTNA